MKKIAILKINHQGYKKGDMFTRYNLVYIYKGENAFGTLYVETEPDIFEIQDIPEYIIITKCKKAAYWYSNKIHNIYKVINKEKYDTYAIEITTTSSVIHTDDCREATPAEVEAFKLGYKIGDTMYLKNKCIGKITKFEYNTGVLMIEVRYSNNSISAYVALPSDTITNIEPKQVFEIGKWYYQIETDVHGLFQNTEEYNKGFIKDKWNETIEMYTRGLWIEANSNRVEQLLLEEAKRRYSIGTRIQCISNDEIVIIKTDIYGNIGTNIILYMNNLSNIKTSVYNNGTWAKIVKEQRYMFYGEMLTKDEIFEKAKKLYTVGTVCRWNDDTSFIKINKEIYLTDASKNVWYIVHDDRIIIKVRDNNIDYATIYKPIE